VHGRPTNGMLTRWCGILVLRSCSTASSFPASRWTSWVIRTSGRRFARSMRSWRSRPAPP